MTTPPAADTSAAPAGQQDPTAPVLMACACVPPTIATVPAWFVGMRPLFCYDCDRELIPVEELPYDHTAPAPRWHQDTGQAPPAGHLRLVCDCDLPTIATVPAWVDDERVLYCGECEMELLPLAE